MTHIPKNPETPETNPNRRATNPEELRRLASRSRRRATGVIVGYGLLGLSVALTEHAVADAVDVSDYNKGVFDTLGTLSAITFVAYGKSRGKEHAKSAQGYTRQARELEKAGAYQTAMPNQPYPQFAGQPSSENAATVLNHEEPETGPVVIPRALFEGQVSQQVPEQPSTDVPPPQHQW